MGVFFGVDYMVGDDVVVVVVVLGVNVYVVVVVGWCGWM